MRGLSLFAAAVSLSAKAFPSLVAAAGPMTNIGTLTCVAAPGSKEPLGVERELSCTFEPLTGPKASLKGVVKRLGASVPGDAKIVLAWSVMGPKLETPTEQLEGRYAGAVGEGRGANTTGLLGGSAGQILLQPLTLDPNIGENAALAIIELQLVSMKA